MDSLWQSCSTGAVAKDDTTVRGTEEVHYPAHVESVRVLRPELEPVSLEGHLEKISDCIWFYYVRLCCADSESFVNAVSKVLLHLT